MFSQCVGTALSGRYTFNKVHDKHFPKILKPVHVWKNVTIIKHVTLPEGGWNYPFVPRIWANLNGKIGLFRALKSPKNVAESLNTVLFWGLFLKKSPKNMVESLNSGLFFGLYLFLFILAYVLVFSFSYLRKKAWKKWQIR